MFAKDRDKRYKKDQADDAMKSSRGEKYSREESKRKPFYKEFWSQPPVDPVFGETGIGCGEKVSWEVLSPGDSQTHFQMELESRSDMIGRQLDSDRPLHTYAWRRPEDDSDKSWRENRFGYHMDPFIDENYTRRGCSNNFNLHHPPFCSDKGGDDEYTGSGNEEPEGGVVKRHEHNEHCDIGNERDISEKQVLRRVRKMRTLPPLISSLSNNNNFLFSHVTPMVLLKPVRRKGRLVLQEVKVVAPAMFQPVRRDGRLLLQVPRQDDDQYMVMKEDDDTSDLEKKDAVIFEESTFNATCASETKISLEELSNKRQDAPEATNSAIKSYSVPFVLCTYCGKKLHEIDSSSEGSNVGCDRQHVGKFCTQCVGGSDDVLLPTEKEVRDYPLPEITDTKVDWPKVCGDMIVNNMQAIPVTSSEQVPGQVNLTKPAYEGRCFYPKERSIDWHLAASRATQV